MPLKTLNFKGVEKILICSEDPEDRNVKSQYLIAGS